MSIMQRAREFSSLFGTLLSGNRDLYRVFGYKNQISFEDMFNKYQRQDIAARIVESEPHATWSNPPVLEGDESYKQVWEDLISDFNLYEKFSRLDKLVGIGKYAVMVIGFDDGKPLTEPADTGSKKKVIYLQPYSEATAEILDFEEDQTNPRFGMPTKYRISPNKVERSTLRSVRQIAINAPFEAHYTRILHVAENGLEDNIYGIPRLERVYNLLDDIIKTSGGSAETFWLTANRGMQVDVDKEMDLKAADAEALSDEIDEYFHNLRRVIRTKGVKINPLGSDVADPRGTFGVLVALLSGATGIPQRILLGSEAGQLASEQDRANWASRIEERRSLFAEPMILIPFSKKLVEANALPAPNSLEYKWPDAFKQNPLERAQTSAQKARTLANVSKALSDENPPIDRDEGRRIIGLDETTPIFDEPSDTDSDANDQSDTD